MNRFYSGIVRHRKAVLICFAVMTVLCFFLEQLVSVNYDINDYLPEDSHSTVSLEIMQEEFDGGIPNARVMIHNVTIPQALEYKKLLRQVEGVSAVTWLDDSVDITVPLAALDADTVAAHYKDGTALFSVTIDEERAIQAIDDIRAIVGDENAISGSAASIAVSTTKTVAEVPMISAISVVFALCVLLLTTASWVEPLVVLAGIGVAVVVNGGTNLIFGEISFITNASGSILQLAVSLDYSVFLVHRFHECLKKDPDPEEAMVDALCRSTSSIFSSGMTTVIGFLALALMQFKIGPDLGLALAKGVGISLATVFIFTPALIVSVYPLIRRTHHRDLIPSLQGFGKLVRRVTIPAACAFAVLVAPAYLASNANSYYYGASEIFGADTQYGADTVATDELFGVSDTYVLLVPKGDTATQTKLSGSLHELDNVTGIISFVDMAGAEIPTAYLDDATLALLESEHYARMVISVSVPTEGEDTFALVENIRRVAQSYYPDEYYLAGRGVSTYDLMDTITADMMKVNLLAVAAVFLVLLLTMRSVLLPVILVLAIESAIWLNLSIPYFTDNKIFYIAYLIISAIQLGATVDYAILMADRYRENRRTLERSDAVVKTISDVTVSILISGSVMAVVGMMMNVISSNRLLGQLGLLIGRGAIFSLLIVFFVLPGLLYLSDKFTVSRKPGKLLRSIGGKKS